MKTRERRRALTQGRSQAYLTPALKADLQRASTKPESRLTVCYTYIMDDPETDIEPAISAAANGQDRGESPGLMEPLLVPEGSPHRTGLTDLAIELAARSAGFRRSLPDGVMSALADLVRAMSCYYSNLIEGHDTHPVDIERALRNDYSAEPEKRNLQLEARAHIAVQQWIDEGGLNGRATTAQGICEIHRRFAQLLPEDLLWVEDPGTGERIRVTRCGSAMSGSAAMCESAPGPCRAF